MALHWVPDPLSATGDRGPLSAFSWGDALRRVRSARVRTVVDSERLAL